jgi:hypothetical protein
MFQTRIASGCSRKETEELDEFHRKYIEPLRPGSFHVHFTPGYGRVHQQEAGPGEDPHPHQGSYKYMNKPYAFF